MKKGKVYLVGAGPGDPKLLTIKGLEAIQSANIILHDRLASDELLAHAPKDCEFIFVGKKSAHHYVTQQNTIKLLIEHAKEGKTVVRLKGGDPLIFGRGSEEAIALAEENIDFEIIPGITAASGATTYAGIPLTHRNLATQCLFVTGHESQDKSEMQVDWSKLAKLDNTTIVIYMGASRISKISDELIKNGMPSNTPAALIENGTLPSQRSFAATISELPDAMKKLDFSPPLLIVISPTVEISMQIANKERKPLANKNICVTRAIDQSAEISRLINDSGGQVIHLPLIKTISKSHKNLNEILANSYDWIFFTSENGVRYFFEQLFENNKDSRAFSNSKVAAIGSKTAQKLMEYGIIADFVPDSYSSKDLIEEISREYNLTDASVLRIKGYFDKDPLTDGLENKGSNVQTYEAYELMANKPDKYSVNRIANQEADVILFMSPSTVDSFVEVFGTQSKEILSKSIAASIGPVTEKALRKHGFENIITAENYTAEGLIDIIIKRFSTK